MTGATAYVDHVYIEANSLNASDEVMTQIVAEAVPVGEAAFKEEFLPRNGLE